MSEKVFDIHIITDPDTVTRDGVSSDGKPISKADLKAHLTNMRKHYENRGVHTIYVKDLGDLVRQVQGQAQKKGAKIRNLIIGAHGAYGVCRIGKTLVNGDKNDAAALRKLRPLFAKDANVYILACHTGQSENALKNISDAFGGVKVHGYTGNIVTTDYWLDVGMNEEGEHLVCFKNLKDEGCDKAKSLLPHREQELRMQRALDLRRGPPN